MYGSPEFVGEKGIEEKISASANTGNTKLILDNETSYKRRTPMP